MEPNEMATKKKSAPADWPPRQERALELAGTLMREIAALADLSPRSKHDAAATRVAAVEEVLAAMLELMAAVCWRCGANLIPPPAEVEEQIAINARAAAWQGWLPGEFAARCREVMCEGDRIVGLRGGMVAIRRADGSLLEVLRRRA